MSGIRSTMCCHTWGRQMTILCCWSVTINEVNASKLSPVLLLLTPGELAYLYTATHKHTHGAQEHAQLTRASAVSERKGTSTAHVPCKHKCKEEERWQHSRRISQLWTTTVIVPTMHGGSHGIPLYPLLSVFLTWPFLPS